MAAGTQIAIAEVYGVSGQVNGDRVGDFQSPISLGVSFMNLMAGSAIYRRWIFNCRIKWLSRFPNGIQIDNKALGGMARSTARTIPLKCEPSSMK